MKKEGGSLSQVEAGKQLLSQVLEKNLVFLSNFDDHAFKYGLLLLSYLTYKVVLQKHIHSNSTTDKQVMSNC